MGIGNILVLCQVTAFVLAVILSFFVFPPVAVSKTHNFNDHCILNTKGHFTVPGVGDVTFVIDEWGNPSGCNFAIFIGCAVMLSAVFQIVRLSFHLFNETDGTFLATFLTAIVNVILTVMLFASALTVTQGYNEWCAQLAQDTTLKNCADAQFIERFWKDLDVQPMGFPIHWGLAQFGLWSSFIVWITICVFSFVKLLKLHKQEDIVRSLSRERQRLLGEDRGPTVYDQDSRM